MTKRTRRTFSPEFKLEAEQLVVDQGCSVVEAPKAIPLPPEQIEIRALIREISRSK
ncbi:hypothetical protein HOP39_07335 [Vibrio coralliilyticus]|nr:hypothetical protein [Vibrio coralliilyticus]